jgi:hypothetical protein
MTPDVEAVLAELDGHRIQFTVLCRSLSEEQLQRSVPQSTWLVRDYIAHLATIDGPVGEMFATVHEGRDPGTRTADGERWDVDRWNEDRVQERRELGVDDLLMQAAVERTKLRNQLAALTEADLNKKIKFQGDARRPAAEIELRSYLRGWCKHDVMHAVDMMRALPERMTPRLEHWLDDPVVAMYQKAMNGGAS